MVTGNGNPDPIPPDFAGRVLWASKHYGVMTVFAGVLLYQGGRFIETQSAERKEQGEFLRETLTAINGKAVEVVTEARMAIEAQTRESEMIRRAIERNTTALEKITEK